MAVLVVWFIASLFSVFFHWQQDEDWRTQLSRLVKGSEIVNRPDLRFVDGGVRFDWQRQTFIFPIKNHGKGTANGVTVRFDSNQLLSYMGETIEYLPSGESFDFLFKAFHPVPNGSPMEERQLKLIKDIKFGGKALVFVISGSYEWNGQDYSIPERSGFMTKDKTYLSLSDAMIQKRDRDAEKHAKDIGE